MAWLGAALTGFAVALAVSPAAAQGTGPPVPSPVPDPSNPADFGNPHPTMPWSLGPATPYGQFIRYVWVPPQPVVIDTPVAQTEEGGVGLERQVVQVPGYFASETTLGYYFPQRWVLERVGPGAYRWRWVPAEFRRRG